MYILNIMTGKWTGMNETLPSPSLSFQGGEIWGKGFREEDIKQLCLT